MSYLRFRCYGFFLKLVSDCLRSGLFKVSRCLFWRKVAKRALLKSVLWEFQSWVSGVSDSKHLTSLGGLMSEHELSDFSRYQKPSASSTPIKRNSQNGLTLNAFYQVLCFFYSLFFFLVALSRNQFALKNKSRNCLSRSSSSNDKVRQVCSCCSDSSEALHIDTESDRELSDSEDADMTGPCIATVRRTLSGSIDNAGNSYVGNFLSTRSNSSSMQPNSLSMLNKAYSVRDKVAVVPVGHSRKRLNTRQISHGYNGMLFAFYVTVVCVFFILFAFFVWFLSAFFQCFFL